MLITDLHLIPNTTVFTFQFYGASALFILNVGISPRLFCECQLWIDSVNQSVFYVLCYYCNLLPTYFSQEIMPKIKTICGNEHNLRSKNQTQHDYISTKPNDINITNFQFSNTLYIYLE